MKECHLKRTQTELSRVRRSIFKIPRDRRSRMGKLHPDLMMAAGQKPDSQKALPFLLPERLITQLTSFSPFCSFRDDSGSVGASVLQQIIHKGSLLWGKFSTDQRLIPLLRVDMVLNLTIQIRRRFLVFSHQKNPLHRLIQTVHKSQTGTSLSALHKLTAQHAHHIRHGRPGALNRKSGRLIEHENVSVLI